MVTVFTPTYNRAYVIDNLYQSLLRQTNMDFEWIVVDDGSTDDTELYFRDVLSKEQPFPIYYEKQENGGKHRAINRGIPLAKGELFFIVDSDDTLTDDAIEKLSRWYDTIKGQLDFCGISGNKGYTEERLVGTSFSAGKYVDCKNSERRKCHISGDKAEAWITDILAQYPFPEFEGERFLTEATVWNAMARDGYKIRYFGDIIYLCDYLEDGLTKNMERIWRENPKGALAWARVELQAYRLDWRQRFRTMVSYCRAVDGRKNWRTMAKELGVPVLEFSLYIWMAHTLVAVKNKLHN